MTKKDDDRANMNVFNAILTKAINTTPQKTVDKKKSKIKKLTQKNKGTSNGK
jgi:hypothetical protein